MATYARCEGLSSHKFIANFLENLPVKEFEKSLEFRRSYCDEFGVSH